jgi:hypothetical protein
MTKVPISRAKILRVTLDFGLRQFTFLTQRLVSRGQEAKLKQVIDAIITPIASDFISDSDFVLHYYAMMRNISIEEWTAFWGPNPPLILVIDGQEEIRLVPDRSLGSVDTVGMLERDRLVRLMMRILVAFGAKDYSSHQTAVRKCIKFNISTQ